MVIYIWCLILNLPAFFMFKPKLYLFHIKNQSNGYEEIIQMHTFDANKFFATQFGIGVLFAQFLTRDLLVLILQIVLNIVTLLMFKRYLAMFHTYYINHTTIISRIFSRFEAQTTKMVILMCVLSSLEQTLVIVFNVYVKINPNVASKVLGALSLFSISFKNAINFFVLIFFNARFRRMFSKSFCQRYSKRKRQRARSRSANMDTF